MPNTNFEQQRDFYDKILNEDYNRSKAGSEYKKVMDALRELAVHTDNLHSASNPDGLMTADAYQHICNAYKNVIIACGEFATKHDKGSRFEQSRLDIVKELGSVATKDMKILNGLDKNHPGTLKNAIKEARNVKLHFSENSLKKVGGAQSSRIPIKTAHGHKGYFTKTNIYNLDKVWTESVTKHINDIPKKYHHIFEKLKTDTDIQNKFVSMLPTSFPYTEFDKDITGDTLAASLEKIGIGSFDEIMDVFENNQMMGQAVLDVVQDILKHKVTIGMMEAAGIKKGSRIDQRNCAMSDMSKLLGCSDIIADAKPMEIYIDGETVEGVFMENVEGVDIGNIPHDFDVTKTNKDNFFNADSLSQLADLQVLDYICGNLDRHDANIIYNFEKLPDGTQRVKSIKGIDNDCSFGTVKLNKDDTVYLKMAGPAGIGYINEEMAKKLASIDISSIKLMLANDELSPEEIEAAGHRLNQIKELVVEKKIQVMKKDDWKKADLKNLAKHSEYFKRMDDMADKFSMNKKAASASAEREFTEGHELTASYLLSENYSKLQQLKTAMAKSHVMLHVNSAEFNKMEKSFNHVVEIYEQLKTDYIDKKLELPPADNQKLVDAIKDLKDSASGYVLAKGVVPSTDYGKYRLQMAKEFRRFTNDYLANNEIKKETPSTEIEEATDEMEL